MTISDINSVVSEIRIAASPRTVFAYFVDPDKLVRWIGTRVEIEPRPGGAFAIDMNPHTRARGEYLELEGETAAEGQWVDRCVGLDGVRNDIVMVRTPDGHGRLELIRFHAPPATAETPNAPVNTLGIRCIMFAVDDIEVVLARLPAHGAELIGAVVQYEDRYRLCYLRGPEGIIVALAQEIG